MRGRSRSLWPAVLAVGGSAALIVVLSWPMLFSDSGMAQDWTGHLWELWRQSLTIDHEHVPGYFISAYDTVLLPLFGYYGGTLFSIGGALAVLLGGAVRAYVALWLLGFAAAYGGWYWLARMAGLGRWLAHVPGLLFITSAYSLTLVYARGGINEFIGVSMIPLMLAAGICLATAERWRSLPALALAASTLVFFGSHNITMLWGTSFVAIVGLAVAIAVPEARARPPLRGLPRVAAIAVPAALVNAWYLVPALAYGGTTWVSTGNGLGTASSLYETKPLMATEHILTLSRASASPEAPGFALALPVLAIVWAAVAVVLVLRDGSDSPRRRVLLVLAGLTIAVAIPMTQPRVVLWLPKPWELVQFTYRLESYFLLGLSGAILVALVLLERGRRVHRVWAWMLAPVVAVSLVSAAIQVKDHPDVEPERDAVFAPDSKLGQAQLVEQRLTYSDVSLELVDSTRLPVAVFDVAAAQAGERASATLRVPPRQRRVLANLAANPRFVELDGARFAGRDRLGFAVLELPSEGDGSARTITVRSIDRTPVALGRAVSVTAALVLSLVLLVGAAAGRRARRPSPRA